MFLSSYITNIRSKLVLIRSNMSTSRNTNKMNTNHAFRYKNINSFIEFVAHYTSTPRPNDSMNSKLRPDYMRSLDSDQSQIRSREMAKMII